MEPKRYNVVVQVFAATGDDLEILAMSPETAEETAKQIVEAKFIDGFYGGSLGLHEVCINSVEEIPDEKCVEISFWDGVGVETACLTVSDAAERARDFILNQANEGLRGTIKF